MTIATQAGHAGQGRMPTASVSPSSASASSRGVPKCRGVRAAEPGEVPLPSPRRSRGGDGLALCEHLDRAAITRSGRAFIELVRRFSRADAALRRKSDASAPDAERDFDGCDFDLATWARAAGWDRSHMRRVRDRLVREGVLRFEPERGRTDAVPPTRLRRVAIERDYSRWLPLDPTYRAHLRALHSRPRAGRPPTRPSARSGATPTSHPDGAQMLVSLASPPRGLPAHSVAQASEHGRPDFHSGGERGPSDSASVFQESTLIGGSTLACHPAPPGPAGSDPRGHWPHTAPSAPSAARPASAHSPTPGPTSQLACRTPQPEPSAPPPALVPLPPRRRDETVRTYWTRLYREQIARDGGREPRWLVMRAAAELLGMDLSADDERLFVALRRRVGGWGALLQWIIAAASRDLIDPRAYLIRMVSSACPQPADTISSDGTARTADGEVPEPNLDPQAELHSLHDCHGGDVPLGIMAPAAAETRGGAHTRAVTPPDPRPRSDPQLRFAWDQVKRQLREGVDVSASAYDSWVRSTSLALGDDGALTVVVRSTAAREQFEMRFRDRAELLLRSALGAHYDGHPLRVALEADLSLAPDTGNIRDDVPPANCDWPIGVGSPPAGHPAFHIGKGYTRPSPSGDPHRPLTVSTPPHWTGGVTMT